MHSTNLQAVPEWTFCRFSACLLGHSQTLLNHLRGDELRVFEKHFDVKKKNGTSKETYDNPFSACVSLDTFFLRYSVNFQPVFFIIQQAPNSLLNMHTEKSEKALQTDSQIFSFGQYTGIIFKFPLFSFS